MALSGRPAEAYATLALAEGLAAALPGVRTRPERGLRASRILSHQPEISRLARDRDPALAALHDAKKRAGGRGGGGGGGGGGLDATTLDAFLAVAAAHAQGPLPASPTSQASQGGVGEADIVFVLERAPSSAESAALRTLLSEALRGADCFDALMPAPAPPPAALDEAPGSDPATAPGSDPATPPGQSTAARVGPADLRGVVPSPERAPERVNAACYLLCEVTADARWLLHKLVQLELNARALALSALGKAVSEAWEIAPHEIALIVATVGVAAPLLAVPSRQQAPRVVGFIQTHLPFVAHMHATGRLCFMDLREEGHNTNVIVANLLLSNVALTSSHEALASSHEALTSSFEALAADVAALKRDVAEILSLLRADRAAVPATLG